MTTTAIAIIALCALFALATAAPSADRDNFWGKDRLDARAAPLDSPHMSAYVIDRGDSEIEARILAEAHAASMAAEARRTPEQKHRYKYHRRAMSGMEFSWGDAHALSDSAGVLAHAKDYLEQTVRMAREHTEKEFAGRPAEMAARLAWIQCVQDGGTGEYCDAVEIRTLERMADD